MKKNLRDKAVAAQLLEEERTGKKKPEVIPNPGLTSKKWSDMMEAEEANPGLMGLEDELEPGEVRDTDMT